jgi:hypothetical protein
MHSLRFLNVTRLYSLLYGNLNSTRGVVQWIRLHRIELRIHGHRYGARYPVPTSRSKETLQSKLVKKFVLGSGMNG